MVISPISRFCIFLNSILTSRIIASNLTIESKRQLLKKTVVFKIELKSVQNSRIS